MTHRTLRSLTAGVALLVAPVAHAQGDEAPAEKPEGQPASTEEASAKVEPAKSEVKLSTNAASAESTAVPAASAPTPASEGLSFETHGWSFGVYGYAALNVMHDSTQSFGPAAGNTVLQRVGTFRGNNDQLQLTARDSRLGFKIGAPEMSGVKTSAVMEADFSGTQPTESSEQTSNVQNPLRMRHYYLKAETPVVDVLAGQYHDLFGWGGKGFYPSTLAFLGITGQIYHRQAQLRISKTFASSALDFEIAAAAARGVQRASGLPDGEAGLRVAINGWKGIGQQAYGQPGLSPLQIGLSGIGRRFEVAQFVEFPGGSNMVNGYGVAANVFLPVVPARSVSNRSNALSITGEFSTGSGISDMYNSDLTGGVLFPTLPNPEGRGVDPAKPPPVYSPNIDSGIVTYDGNGKVQPVKWQAFVVGLQYYLPVLDGRIWLSGNFSQLKSSNAVKLTPIAGRSAVYKQARYVDGNLFVALTSTLQVGYSFQMVEQTFGDDVKARNYRNEGAIHFFF
ncbi:MAG TPA: hypothetical protein VHB79_13420 [Polyangiaceae bacterium]|nr:hypothetical protein [Polyangiaceae bacterium]